MASGLQLVDHMMSVKETPWHRIGTVLPQAPSIEEALVAAKLDWTVEKTKIQLVDAQGNPIKHSGVIDKHAIMRSDSKEFLGVVGTGYTPLQNREAFDFFDPFIKDDSVHLETAGSLRGNKIVWVMGKIQNSVGEAVKGDPINRYVLLCHGHDGSMSVRVGFTDVRVVCQNTMNMAFNSKASQLIRIKHSKQVVQNLTNVQEVMKITDAEFRANLKQLAKLATKNINQEDVRKFVHVNFFDSIDLTKASTKMKNNYKTTLDKISELCETGKGHDLKGVRGTVYGLFNAGTEYLTHHDYKEDATGLNSLWFGDNAKMNAKLFEYSMDLVSA